MPPFRQPTRNAAGQVFTVLALWCAAAGSVTAQQVPDYEKDVKPILSKNCYACHSSSRAMGGIRLDIRAGAVAKGDSGRPAILPGDSGGSEIIHRLTATGKNMRMPLGGQPLPAESVAIVRSWIEAGASWPESAADMAVRRPGPVEMQVTDRDRQHWAFRPLQKVQPPAVKDAAWQKNPIDRFVFAALDAKGLAPSPQASKAVLIRRLYFTVIGLPPTPAEVQAFLNDSSPQAYDHLVEGLLANPHYGERWARHWLDVARYADSEGYNRDADRPAIYRYRDFVIRAFNDDMPFTKFVRWQIAGDEYEPDNPEAVTATGFLAAGPREHSMVTDTPENKLQYIYDELDDLVSTTSQAMLGLTVGCARCHDHKFDPIPTRDYYRLAAAFRNFDRKETYLSRPHRALEQWAGAKRAELREQKIQASDIPEEARVSLRAPLEKNNSGQVFFYKKYDEKLRFTEDEFQAWLSPADRATYEGLKHAVADVEQKLGKEPPKGFVVVDSQATPIDSYLLGRGSARNRKEKVQFGFLSVLTRGNPSGEYRAAVAKPGLASTFQRGAVAEWLVDVDRGAGALLARVIVNRLWQHNFGEGLVNTPNDFGLQGEKPSHPELLEWLAGELIRNGWQLKPIQRLILTSSAYRLSTEYDKNSAHIDADERLLWRRRPLRMEAEALRDYILAVSGSLNDKMYGPGVRPHIPVEATVTRSKDKWSKDNTIVEGSDVWRRSVYVFAKRTVRLPWLETFDAPDWTTSCGRRVPTTVPTQALSLMNDPFVREQARRFAARIGAEAPAGNQSQITYAYQLAFGRPPSPAEMAAGLTFLPSRNTDAAENQQRLVNFCHVLFTLNEFMFVE
jgi:hypothetical protein